MSDVQREIRAFVAARGWEPFHDAKNLAMGVASEAGELLAELRWVPSEEADARASRPDVRARLAAEAADVAITLLMFCDRVDIDLVAAMRDKMAANAKKYPQSFMSFDEPTWNWIPWSGRRALDHAGLKLSLDAWQGLPLSARAEVVECGSRRHVDLDRVKSALADAEPAPRPSPPRRDPDPDAVPAPVTSAFAELTLDEWKSLPLLTRYALDAYVRLGKLERAARVYESASTSSGRSQSLT